jgi:hypothetical protein
LRESESRVANLDSVAGNTSLQRAGGWRIPSAWFIIDKCLNFFFHGWVALLVGIETARVNSFSFVRPQI